MPPGKARRIRPPRLRRYAHRCVCFARRQGISAPSPCPSVARAAREPVRGCVRFAGAVPAPWGGGGGRLSLGRWNHRQGSRGPHLLTLGHCGPGGGGRLRGGLLLSYYQVHLAGGREEAQPSGVEWHPARPAGSHHSSKTGLGGTGSPAQGVFGSPCKTNGGPSSSENRAHRPGGDGEPSPGGVRSLLQGLRGAIIFGEPGAPAWGGRGAQPRGCSEPPSRPMGGQYLRRTGRTCLGGTGSPAQGGFGASCKANGGPSSSENRAHRPGGDKESSPGGVRSLLQGQWGAIIFGEPGAPA